MARAKKNGTYLNVCIETPIYERLERLCEDAGQTKTVAVERALTAYLEDYEKTDAVEGYGFIRQAMSYRYEEMKV